MAETGASVAAPETATEKGSMGLDALSAAMQATAAPESVAEKPTEQPEPELEPEELDPQAEAEDLEEGEEQEQEEPEGEPQSILERFGLDQATEEERRDINKALGGKAGERISQLTARAKTAEEEAAKLRAELSKKLESPLSAKSAGDNPYQNVNDRSELESTYAAALEMIETGQDLLDGGEGQGPDEVIGELNGKEVTKREVKAAVRKAEKARDIHLPARAEQLKQLSTYEAERQKNAAALSERFTWLNDENSELRQNYEIEAGRMRPLIEQHMPQYLPHFETMLAYYADGISAPAKAEPETKQEAPKKKAPQKPPSNPGSSVGASSRPTASARKRRQQAASQFMESRGTHADLSRLFLANNS